MDEKKSRLILLIGYCVPYIFLCLYGDAVWGTGIIYGVAVAALVALCFLACKTGNIKTVVLGNVFSFLTSQICAMLLGLEALNRYFEPFNAQILICICSVIAILIQAYVISRLTDDRKRQKRMNENRWDKNAGRGFWGKK